MYTLTILNLLNNKVFEKQFSSPYFMEEFKRKAKYNNKIKVIGEIKGE